MKHPHLAEFNCPFGVGRDLEITTAIGKRRALDFPWARRGTLLLEIRQGPVLSCEQRTMVDLEQCPSEGRKRRRARPVRGKGPKISPRPVNSASEFILALRFGFPTVEWESWADYMNLRMDTSSKAMPLDTKSLFLGA